MRFRRRSRNYLVIVCALVACVGAAASAQAASIPVLVGGQELAFQLVTPSARAFFTDGPYAVYQPGAGNPSIPLLADPVPTYRVIDDATGVRSSLEIPRGCGTYPIFLGLYGFATPITSTPSLAYSCRPSSDAGAPITWFDLAQNRGFSAPCNLFCQQTQQSFGLLTGIGSRWIEFTTTQVFEHCSTPDDCYTTLTDYNETTGVSEQAPPLAPGEILDLNSPTARRRVCLPQTPSASAIIWPLGQFNLVQDSSILLESCDPRTVTQIPQPSAGAFSVQASSSAVVWQDLQSDQSWNGQFDWLTLPNLKPFSFTVPTQLLNCGSGTCQQSTFKITTGRLYLSTPSGIWAMPLPGVSIPKSSFPRQPTDPPRRRSKKLPKPTKVVLGSASYPAKGGLGFGRPHPRRFANDNLDRQNLVTHIRWRHWGNTSTTGKGTIQLPYINGPTAVTLIAYDLGRCTPHGPLAYRRLDIRQPTPPPGHLSPWQSWSGFQTLCKTPF